MSIRPDNWIRAQCEKPTHVIRHAAGNIEYASEPLTANQKLIKYNQETLMDLNSKFATNLTIDPIGRNTDNSPIISSPIIDIINEEELFNWKPMIEPFVNKPVREIDGKKIISYGLSGFGYDVRLSNQFKVFTNINSSIIDPS